MRLKPNRLLKALASRRLAAAALVAFVAFIVVSTAVPHVPSASFADIESWKQEHPALARVAAPLGLYDPYGTPLFQGLVALLAASTLSCSLERVRSARRILAVAGRTREATVGASHLRPTHSVLVGRDGASDALDRLGGELAAVRMNPRIVGDMLTARRSLWAVWGSPVFHWLLVILIVTAGVGQLLRWSGVVGALVGVERSIDPSAFTALDRGPLANLDSVPRRTVTVESMAVEHVAGDTEVGHAPLVTLRENGAVVARSLVYPNSPMRYGGLFIHRDYWGLGALLTYVSESGEEIGKSQMFFEFVSIEKGGRITLVAPAPEGAGVDQVQAVVRLDPTEGGYRADIPTDPRIEFSYPGSGETTAVVLRSGDSVPLPNGAGEVRVDVITRQTRLHVVYDPTIRIMYAVLVLLALAAAVALLVHPRAVIASVRETGDGGVRMDVTVISRRVDTLFRHRINTFLAELEDTDGDA